MLPSPYINQFISADTIVPDPTDPQSWNRYSYVTNNPLRYTDPTGHMRIQDGPQQDRFKQSVANKYIPKPKKQGKGGGGGGTSAPTVTPTPSPSSVPTPTLTASITPACSDPSNLCTTIVAGQSTFAAFQTSTATSTSTPFMTSTPFLRNEVNAVADDIFGRPDAGPGLTDLVPWGRYVDGAVGGAHFIGDMVEVAKHEPPMTQQQARAGLGYTILAFVTTVLPWVLAL